MGTPKEQSEPHTSVERRIAGDGGIEAKVLVTGAAGHLGRRVAAALVRCGADVRALVRDPTRAPHEVQRDTEVATGNVADGKSVRKAMLDVDLVVHCAAVTTNNVSWSVHEQTNIGGSRNVLRAAREAGVRRLVHVSSVIVYGLDEPADRGALTESALPPEPDRWGLHQRSKLGAERAMSSGSGPDTEVVIVRPGIVYGPGSAGALERKLVQLGPFRLTLGRGDNHLPLVYVDNVVDGILLALASPAAAGEAYNLVDQPQPESGPPPSRRRPSWGTDTACAGTEGRARVGRGIPRATARPAGRTPSSPIAVSVASATRASCTTSARPGISWDGARRCRSRKVLRRMFSASA